jgi:hypothetical protein
MNLDEFLYKNSELFDGEIDEEKVKGALNELSDPEFAELLVDMGKQLKDEFVETIAEEICYTAQDF